MLDVYVGTTTCAVAGTVFDAGWQAGLDDCLAQAKPPRGWRRPALRLWLSGALARPFVVDPVQGLRRWSEAQALTQAQANMATGLDGPCRVLLEDWPGARPALAVAVERLTLDGTQRSVQAAGMRVASIRPWWARAHERCASTRVLTVIEPDSFTVLAGDRDAFVLAATYAPRPQDEPSFAARLALTTGVPADRASTVEWTAGAW